MPAPVSDSELIRPGDVGYVRAGCFHLLFHAGLLLGERKRGADVPRNFKQLHVGKIVEHVVPLGADPLCTSGVRIIDPLPSSQPPPSTPSTSTSPPKSLYVCSVASASFSLRPKLQGVGASFHYFVPAHWGTRRCPPDQIFNLQRRRATNGQLRKIY